MSCLRQCRSVKEWKTCFCRVIRAPGTFDKDLQFVSRCLVLCPCRKWKREKTEEESFSYHKLASFRCLEKVRIAGLSINFKNFEKNLRSRLVALIFATDRFPNSNKTDTMSGN